MTDRISRNLFDEIDGLVMAYLAAARTAQRETILSDQVDTGEMLKHGAYPPSDPRSEPAAALMQLAGRLRANGDITRLKDVLDAYRAEFGPKRAATLNARWQYLAEQ